MFVHMSIKFFYDSIFVYYCHEVKRIYSYIFLYYFIYRIVEKSQEMWINISKKMQSDESSQRGMVKHLTNVETTHILLCIYLDMQKACISIKNVQVKKLVTDFNAAGVKRFIPAK